MARVPTDGFARQLQQVVRKVLGQKPGDLGTPFDFAPTGQNLQFIRVTGVGTTVSGRTYYPGVPQRKNPTSGVVADVSPSVTVWLEDINGHDIVTDGTARYLAKQVNSGTNVSGTTRALFETVAQECSTAAADFPTIDETQTQPTTKLLASDPALGTRNLQLQDAAKAIQKAQGVFTITYSATPTLNLHNGLRQRLTMAGNPTISISNDWDTAAFLLETVQDGTGGRVPTFWSGITWQGQIQPRPTLTANARDLYHFERIASGNYRGVAMLNR